MIYNYNRDSIPPKEFTSMTSVKDSAFTSSTGRVTNFVLYIVKIGLAYCRIFMMSCYKSC